MLVIRFKETFRERVPEWTLATGMIGWGLLTLASPNLFIDKVFWASLLAIASQDVWGTAVTTVGFMRLVFLVINGAWRPSAHIRAIGCVFGVMLWGSLFISILSMEWVTPTSSIYGALIGLDLLSLWFAAGDAKLADLSVRGKIRAV